MNDFFEKNIFTLSFLANLIVEIVGGLLFLFIILVLLRPRIRISPEIAKNTDQFDPNGRMCWVFKIVNMSLFSAFDVQVELMEKITYPAHPQGNNVRMFPLTLKINHIPHVSPFRPRWMKKDYSDYALRFRTYDDLDTILNDQMKSVQIKVTLKHGLTGLGKVFSHQYVRSAIKLGHFSIGNDFKIN